MDISKKKTLILVLISILWLACIILGTTEKFVLGMVVAVPLIGLHFLLGVAKKGYCVQKIPAVPNLDLDGSVYRRVHSVRCICR